jgi:hypothetical protein
MPPRIVDSAFGGLVTKGRRNLPRRGEGGVPGFGKPLIAVVKGKIPLAVEVFPGTGTHKLGAGIIRYITFHSMPRVNIRAAEAPKARCRILLQKNCSFYAIIVSEPPHCQENLSKIGKNFEKIIDFQKFMYYSGFYPGDYYKIFVVNQAVSRLKF